MTPKELEFCSFVEQVFRLRGAVPTEEVIRDRLGIVSHAEFQRYWESPPVRGYLSSIGIDVAKIEAGTTDVLTPTQLLAVNTLLDFNDPRPDHRKLQQLGISGRTWDTWKSDPAFKAYYKERIEKFAAEGEEVERALFERAKSGDTQAIKFYYEATGKYRPQTGSQAIDVRLMILRVQEVITRNLHDQPEILYRIGLELEALAADVAIGNNNSSVPVGVRIETVPGELVPEKEPAKELGF